MAVAEIKMVRGRELVALAVLSPPVGPVAIRRSPPCAQAFAILLRRCTFELLDKNPSVLFVPMTKLASGPAVFKFNLNPL